MAYLQQAVLAVSNTLCQELQFLPFMEEQEKQGEDGFVPAPPSQSHSPIITITLPWQIVL